MKIAKTLFKRGDIVQFVYPGETPLPYKYRISAVSPDNSLSPDRVDVCELDNIEAFKGKRGVGMPIKYLRKVNENH